MSHIRKTPARPAPPVATPSPIPTASTSTLDTPQRSASSSSSISSSSTISRAHSHLSRVHADLLAAASNSDRASIYSARSRAASTSSSRTATPSVLNSGSAPEELELTRPEGTEGTVEQVVKRQKVDRKPSPPTVPTDRKHEGSAARESGGKDQAQKPSLPVLRAFPELDKAQAASKKQRKSSWFGYGGEPSDGEVAAADVTQIETTTPEPNPNGTMEVASTEAPTSSESMDEIRRAKSRGWLSSLPLMRSASSGSVKDYGTSSPAEPKEEATQESSEDTTGIDTLKAIPEDNTATVTARPTNQSQNTAMAYQRASWWGWGGPSNEQSPVSPDDSAPPPSIGSPQSTSPVVQAMDSSASSVDTQSISSITSVNSVVRPTKSWMQTIWGETPPANVSPTNPVAAAEAPASSHTEEAEVSRPVPAAVSALRSKASWGFFPRRASQLDLTASTTSSTSHSAEELATSPRTNSLLSRSPHAALGILTPQTGSSRASSINSSTPPSPRLGPQSSSDNAPLKPLTGSIRSTTSARPERSEPDPPFENLVLPTFTDTFLRPPRSFPPPQGRITKAVSLVNAYLFSVPPPPLSPEMREGGRMREDPAERLPKCFEVMGELAGPRVAKVKRVVTIGVHGWFPSPMVRSITGEPTGTSVKFATMMHDAVQSFLESQDALSSFNIHAIALEGEGQVESRVEKLFTQLTTREEWVEALKRADVVFLATHSQGSVVSTHLLKRMLEEGLVVGARTHMLAMCAIAQGPFVYLNQSYTLSPYFNYIESAAARELFEFQDPESAVSQKFLESLQTVLSSGVKVTVVGSINDQVTPLYSSLWAGISHPSLLRAVYIDSAAFRTSDFLANLIVFACRLRNAGLRDHDLIYHVSEALAGALTGVGHSKIYEEEEVFNLAVRYQFETTLMADSPTFLPPHVPTEPLEMAFSPRDRRNPYLLTWALRGIVEDPQIRELFSSELSALREAFETWRPTTKVLRDVRLKLEGIRMLPRARREGKL